MKVVLVGMMGSGKSATARSLSRLLGWAAVDTDMLIRSRSGTTIAELFERDGEAGFRAHELAAVRDAVGGPGDAIVALGGGAVTTAEVREVLAGGGPEVAVVQLRTTAGEILRRVGDGKGRPLLQPDPAAAVERLLVARAPLYDEVATITVDTDGRTIDEVAEAIRDALGSAVQVTT